MDLETVIKFVNTVGFSNFVAIYMLLQLNKTVSMMTDKYQALTDSINGLIRILTEHKDK